jgi:hypothetical protein
MRICKFSNLRPGHSFSKIGNQQVFIKVSNNCYKSGSDVFTVSDTAFLVKTEAEISLNESSPAPEEVTAELAKRLNETEDRCQKLVDRVNESEFWQMFTPINDIAQPEIEKAVEAGDSGRFSRLLARYEQRVKETVRELLIKSVRIMPFQSCIEAGHRVFYISDFGISDYRQAVCCTCHKTAVPDDAMLFEYSELLKN